MDHPQAYEHFGREHALLVVLGQPSALAQPRERPLHRPPDRQDHPAFCPGRTSDDREIPPGVLRHPGVQGEVVVLAVRVHPPDGRRRLVVQPSEHFGGRSGVVHVGCRYQDGEQ